MIKENPSGDSQSSLAAGKEIRQVTRWTTRGGQSRDETTTEDGEPPLKRRNVQKCYKALWSVVYSHLLCAAAPSCKNNVLVWRPTLCAENFSNRMRMQIDEKFKVQHACASEPDVFSPGVVGDKRLVNYNSFNSSVSHVKALHDVHKHLLGDKKMRSHPSISGGF